MGTQPFGSCSHAWRGCPPPACCRSPVLPPWRPCTPQIVLVNPQIVNTGKSRNLFEEGCLSFPTIYADVEVGGWVGAGRGPLNRKHRVMVSFEWRAVVRAPRSHSPRGPPTYHGISNAGLPPPPPCSHPLLPLPPQRPSKVRIKAQDLQGRKFTLSLT